MKWWFLLKTFVKDNSGEFYEKHYPPYLNDDIWRLKKIAKDGKIHKRLSSHGIHTVKDLLQLYTTEPFSLYVAERKHIC
ncbi:hypothetical protein S83_007951 [Arachis hypogaea]